MTLYEWMNGRIPKSFQKEIFFKIFFQTYNNNNFMLMFVSFAPVSDRVPSQTLEQLCTKLKKN